MDWWWGQLGSSGQWFNPQCCQPRVCRCLFFACWSLEWLVWRYPGYKWFQRSIPLALGLCNHKGSREGVQNYDKDQVSLVIPDSTGFGSQVPVTLGTPTINWIINMIKESEIDELSVSLNGSRVDWLVACQWAELSIWKETVADQAVDPINLDEAFKTTMKEEGDAFSSKIIHGWMKTLLLGSNMHVVTQSLKRGDGPHLPHGMSVVNMYTEVISGSKWVAVVVQNWQQSQSLSPRALKWPKWLL